MINMNEETFYEGGPAKSDLIINLLAGITCLLYTSDAADE